MVAARAVPLPPDSPKTESVTLKLISYDDGETWSYNAQHNSPLVANLDNHQLEVLAEGLLDERK